MYHYLISTAPPDMTTAPANGYTWVYNSGTGFWTQQLLPLSAVVGEELTFQAGGSSYALDGASYSVTGGFKWTAADHVRNTVKLREMLSREAGTTGYYRLYDLTAVAYVANLQGANNYLTPTTASLDEYVSDTITLVDAHDYEGRVTTTDATKAITWGRGCARVV
jgi:hypothetical protein